MIKTFSCAAGYGAGGLGLNLQQLVEDARVAGELGRYYSHHPRPDDPLGVRVDGSFLNRAARWTPIRFSPAWRAQLDASLFDSAVARRVEATDVFVGFSGQSLTSFRKVAASARWLLSPTAHMLKVRESFEQAFARDPIERSWVNAAVVARAVREYELADLILVGSEYVLRSFTERGVSPAKLKLIHFRIPERFVRAEPRARDTTFRIVYVGSLTVAKGVPRLVEAFSALVGDVHLTLVGGWASRGMRRYLSERARLDPRISIAPGDPLPHLQRADVFVHPSYSDGFGYAPMEALACGVPVIVTEDTGMREEVREGVNGWVVPTGDANAILERLEQLRRSPLPEWAPLAAP